MDQNSFYSLIESDNLETALNELETLPHEIQAAEIDSIFQIDSPNIRLFSLLDWLVCDATGEMCGEACDDSCCCGSGGGACCFCGVCILFAMTQGDCCFSCGEVCCPSYCCHCY